MHKKGKHVSQEPITLNGRRTILSVETVAENEGALQCEWNGEYENATEILGWIEETATHFRPHPVFIQIETKSPAAKSYMLLHLVEHFGPLHILAGNWYASATIPRPDRTPQREGF